MLGDLPDCGSVCSSTVGLAHAHIPGPAEKDANHDEADAGAPRLHCDAPRVKLVGDITYLPTWQGWLNLASVIDCFNREVVGLEWPTPCAPAWSDPT